MVPALAAEGKSAVATIQDFYKRYIGYEHSRTPGDNPPGLALSRAFLAEIKETDALCQKYGEGPCGWGADGDEYLDTQEVDPGLSYSNSGIAISEISHGRVQVKLNVYPSEKGAGRYYQKTITFSMIQENGSYVADDIAHSDGISTRKILSDERRELLQRSNPHSTSKKR